MSYLCFAEVEMHAVVDDGYCLQVKVAHPIDFQLKSQRWFQVAVNAILLELQTMHIHTYRHTSF